MIIQRFFRTSLIIVAMLMALLVKAQSAYIRIVDSHFVPTLQKTDDEQVYHPIVKNHEFQDLLNKHTFLQFKNANIHHEFEWFRSIFMIEMASEQELDKFLNVLSSKYIKEIPYVGKVEQMIADADAFFPDDSLYVAGELSYLDYVRAPEAWNISKHYGKIKVGVADWYCHADHPDLRFDTIFGNNTYNVQGATDHGTVVSGFLAGVTNNHIGIAATGGFNSDLIAYVVPSDLRVRYLAELGCKVINCSWHSSGGYSSYSENLYREILNDLDCIVVCAAGNNAQDGGSLSAPLYPASYSSCLSVTTIGHRYDYGHSAYHNWKDVHCLEVNDTTTSHHHNTAVDVCAPGLETRSTNFHQNIAGYSNATHSGTSFATPIVSGIAAMVRAVNPSLTAMETMNIIKETANASIYDVPENAQYIGRLGTGKVDAYAAVRRACATDIIDSTFTTNSSLEGCIVTLQNVQAQNGITLDIDAVVETTLVSDVEIPLGCSLLIH